jgi:hypothetical protein
MMSETASPGTPDRTFLLQDPEANGRLDGRWQNHPDVTAWAIDLDLPADRLMQVALYVPPHQSWHPNGFRFELSDRGNGRQIASPHLGGSLYNGVYALFHVQGKLRFRFQTAWFYRSTIAGLFFDPPAADAKAGFVKFDFDTSGNWRGKYGAAGHRIVGAKPRLPEGVVIQVPEVVEKQALKWPEGVRRYSYRKWPIFPSDGGGDNIQIAFNAIPPGEDGCLTHLPGRMPGFISYKCSDYQYALNTVAPEYGGGFELWRLESPGMPRKHFYPRQPKHPLEGAVKGARLVTTHDGGTRVTEAAIPWSELPHVRALLDASKPVKFSFRVNHNTGGPTMELAWQRSISRANNHAFHVDWVEHWANEIEFAFERRE